MPAPPPNEDAALLARRQERERFASLVAEGERLAASDPVLYRRRLRRLMLLGNAYIVGVVVLSAFMVALVATFMIVSHSAVALKLLLVAGGFFLLVVRSLWIKSEALPGIGVSRAEAPELFREVDAIADRLSARRVREIRLVLNFNAAAVQRPRFGPFGTDNVLMLGLSLLYSLSPDEARSVVAHEFGHFAGGHGHFGQRVYRLERRWQQLGANLSDSPLGSALFRPFLVWFMPRFEAMSFAIRRQDEYEADRAATQVAGSAAAIQALSRIPYAEEQLDRRYWKPLVRDVATKGAPPSGYLSDLKEAMRSPIDVPRAERLLAAALAERTDVTDTHPSLTDRLRAMGATFPVAVPPMPDETAAEAFLGGDLQALSKRLEAHNAEEMAGFWRHLQEERERSEARLADLETASASRPLTEDEAIERVFLRAEEADERSGIEMFRELVAAYPENAYALFHLGSKLLESEEEEGVARLEEAAHRDPDLRLPAQELILKYRTLQGDRSAVDLLRDEALQEMDRQAIAAQAMPLTLRDEVVPVQWENGERDRLVESLKNVPGLGKAYAIQKRLPGTGETRKYLFVVPKRKLFERDDAASRLADRIAEEVEAAKAYVISSHPSAKPWVKKLDRVPGACVFDHRA